MTPAARKSSRPRTRSRRSGPAPKPAASRWTRLRNQWDALQASKPGHRFQDRYARNRERRQASIASRCVQAGLGIAVLAAGAFLLVVPGPGLPIVIIGAALLATESRPVAKALDWAELKVRPLAKYLHQRWEKLPRAARIAIPIVSTCLSITAALLLRRML